jgi:hypothetical protein
MSDLLKQLENDFSQIRSGIDEVRPDLPAIAEDILRQVKASFKTREALVSYSETAVLAYPFLANHSWVDSYLSTFKIVVDDRDSVTLHIDMDALRDSGFPEDFPTQIETGNPITEIPAIIHLRERYDV